MTNKKVSCQCKLPSERIFSKFYQINSETKPPFRLQRYQRCISSKIVVLRDHQSYGQAIAQKVRIHLQKPFLTYGQFFVAFSKTQTFDDVQVFLNNEVTRILEILWSLHSINHQLIEILVGVAVYLNLTFAYFS